MKTQIPLYRAKKIDSDEYVEGYLVIDPDRGRDYYYIARNTYIKAVEVRKSTLSIHMPDMIDSEGTKIFASLSEDGKGGDIVHDKAWDMDVVIVQSKRVYIKKVSGNFLNSPKYLDALVKQDLKVTGIQE